MFWGGTQAKEEQQRRRAFESALRRPYFHAKPLDDAQLQTWGLYLDAEEARGTPEAFRCADCTSSIPPPFLPASRRWTNACREPFAQG